MGFDNASDISLSPYICLICMVESLYCIRILYIEMQLSRLQYVICYCVCGF
jgi:hypothetical protein